MQEASVLKAVLAAQKSEINEHFIYRKLAQATGGPVVGVVIGSGIAAAAQDAARYVDKVFCCDNAALAAPLAETWAPVLVAAEMLT